MRAKDKNFNATLETNFDDSIGKINIIPQYIGRVLLNIYNNAFYAVNEKAKRQFNGYEPTISVNTKKINNTAELTVKDNVMVFLKIQLIRYFSLSLRLSRQGKEQGWA